MNHLLNTCISRNGALRNWGFNYNAVLKSYLFCVHSNRCGLRTMSTNKNDLLFKNNLIFINDSRYGSRMMTTNNEDLSEKQSNNLKARNILTDDQKLSYKHPKPKYPKFNRTILPNDTILTDLKAKNLKSPKEYWEIIISMCGFKNYQETFLFMSPSLWAIAMYNKNFDITSIDNIWIQFANVFILTNLLRGCFFPISYMFDHVRDADENIKAIFKIK